MVFSKSEFAIDVRKLDYGNAGGEAGYNVRGTLCTEAATGARIRN